MYIIRAMDTRFWGPSGWQLLHLIAASPVENPVDVYDWFHLLEFVLPCKYCRASFHDYMDIQPLTQTIIKDRAAFSRWVYDIHNRVNSKLRGQGLLKRPDPSWMSVRKQWFQVADDVCTTTTNHGWNFITSIAYSTPDDSYKATPMPDAPENTTEWAEMTMATRNRYNLLTKEERQTALTQWWKLLPSILPCEAWRRSWSAAFRELGVPPLQKGRQAVMRWMWEVECSVCGDLQCPTPHPSLGVLRKEVGAFESGCSAAKGNRRKTCRAYRQRKKTRRYTHQKGGLDSR